MMQAAPRLRAATSAVRSEQKEPRARRGRDLIAVTWYCLLAAAILAPLWKDAGIALFLDWTPTPFSLVDSGGALRVHGAPLDAVVDAVGRWVPVWVLQRAILFGALVVAGVAAHRTAPARGFVACVFAGTVYLVNPFTMSRLAAGHWRILVAYALAPFAVRAIVSLTRRPDGRAGLVAGGSITGVALVSAHFVMLGLLLLTGCVAALRQGRAQTIKSFGVAAGVVAVGVSWWVIPALLAPIPLGAGEGALDVFRSEAGGNSTLVSILGLRGFWVEALVPEAHPAWPWVILLLVGLVFRGAALAARDGRGRLVGLLFPAMIVAVIFAVGVSGVLSKPFVEAAYRWVPGLVGFREPHKLLALVALGYAWFGAIALDRPPSQARWARPAGAVVLALAIALPIAATPQIFGGESGHVRPISYPSSWYEARRSLAADPAPGTTLILPWKQYVRLPFADTPVPVADPLRRFLSAPVLASEDPLIGPRSSPHRDPARKAIDRLFVEQGWEGGTAAELAGLDIKYVALVPPRDPEAYAMLFDQADLSVLLRSADLILFRNEAWASRG